MNTSIGLPKSTIVSLVAVFSLCAAFATAYASKDRLCDQTANISPMPGGGYAVDPQGDIEGFGAFQVNIPIAYTPKVGYVVGSGFVGGSPSTHKSLNNLSGVVGGSVGTYPRLWMSAFVLGDDATANAQLMVVNEKEDVPCVSVGVQGIANNKDCNRWGYGVVTKGFGPADGRRLYTTLGLRGSSSQVRTIGGLSYPINQNFNIATEWDGYQLNTAVILRPEGRFGVVTILGGYNGKAGWLAGGALTFNFASH